MANVDVFLNQMQPKRQGVPVTRENTQDPALPEMPVPPSSVYEPPPEKVTAQGPLPRWLGGR